MRVCVCVCVCASGEGAHDGNEGRHSPRRLFVYSTRRSDQIKHPRNQGDISRSGALHREMLPHVLQRDGRVAQTSTAVSN